MTFNIFQWYDCALRSAHDVFPHSQAMYLGSTDFRKLNATYMSNCDCFMDTLTASPQDSLARKPNCRHFYSVYPQDAVLQHLFCPAEYCVCVRFYKYSAKFLKATLTVATTWLSLPAQVAIEAHHGWRLQVSEKQQTQCITHWIPLGFCSWIPKINRTLNTPGYLVDMWKVLIFDYVFNVRFILGIQEQKPNGIQWVIHWVCCFSLTCSLQPWCASIATCAGNESQVVATVRVAFKHLAKYFKKKIQE